MLRDVLKQIEDAAETPLYSVDEIMHLPVCHKPDATLGRHE